MKRKQPKFHNSDITFKQKKAVDLLLSGQATSRTDAMRKAGYKKGSYNKPRYALDQRKGVQLYLKTPDAKSRKLFKVSLEDKVMNTFFEGMDAEKLYGKDAIRAPDYSVRIAAADRFAKFFGWDRGIPEDRGQYNQFNFFNVPKEKQQQYHERLKMFLKNTRNEP